LKDVWSQSCAIQLKEALQGPVRRAFQGPLKEALQATVQRPLPPKRKGPFFKLFNLCRTQRVAGLSNDRLLASGAG
jgi:hypothetical protein